MVEIPAKGSPNIIQCSFCLHKMVIYGFGNDTGAYVVPAKEQDEQRRFIYVFGNAKDVSNNYIIEVVGKLTNCYPE